MASETAPQQPPTPEALLARWPDDFAPTVSRIGFTAIGAADGPRQAFRTRSWEVLVDLHIIDERVLRSAKIKSFGGEKAAELVRELEIPLQQESGLEFETSPLNDSQNRGFCDPREVDKLDIRSFLAFTADITALSDWGRGAEEKRLLRTWKASNKSGPKMVDHWIKAGKYLVRYHSLRLDI